MKNSHNDRIINIMATRVKWLNKKRRYNFIIVVLLGIIWLLIMVLLDN